MYKDEHNSNRQCAYPLSVNSRVTIFESRGYSGTIRSDDCLSSVDVDRDCQEVELAAVL